MSRLVGLLLICALIVLARFAVPVGLAYPPAQATMIFGFLLLTAHLAGDLLSHLGLPRITGYILAGILLGPHALDWVDARTVTELKLIDDLALTFIALAAGGELRLSELRRRRRCISLTVQVQSALVLLGVAATSLAARSWIPFLDGLPLSDAVAVAGLLGVFALARSPSSAIAIISEAKARGPFTDMVLGVTVVMDVLVIVVFAVAVSVARTLVGPDGSFDVAFLTTVALELAGSLAAGVVVGWLISLYIRRVGAELAVFLLATCFLVTFSSHQFAQFLNRFYDAHFDLEPMLICMVAGFWVQNFSTAGERLMDKIDRSSLPIYVVFFSLTGAALDLGALRDTWLVALLLVAIRALLIWIGAYAGARLAGDPPAFRRMSGLSFVTQAGVSLGLAGIVQRSFPEWGAALATTIVAVISLNQVIGPAGFKIALSVVGEDRQATAARGNASPEA